MKNFNNIKLEKYQRELDNLVQYKQMLEKNLDNLRNDTDPNDIEDLFFDNCDQICVFGLYYNEGEVLKDVNRYFYDQQLRNFIDTIDIDDIPGYWELKDEIDSINEEINEYENKIMEMKNVLV